MSVPTEHFYLQLRECIVLADMDSIHSLALAEFSLTKVRPSVVQRDKSSPSDFAILRLEIFMPHKNCILRV